MKKYLQIMALAGIAITLTGCGRLKDSSLANNATTTSTTKKKSYQTTNTGNSGYSVLLKNGRYVVSPIAGLTATDNDNSVDTRELERGLIQISKNQFSTNQYVFQEGQQLDTSTVTDWLTRKSKTNPQGLNPVNNGKTGTDTRNPIYLEEIVEQDYLTGSGSKYQLGGMSLGLAMNSVDYYQKKRDGAEFQTDISKATQRAQGEKIANEIVARLRKRKSLKNIPITIGLFSKTGKDSLVGGTYFAYGTAAANSSKITKWKSMSEKMQVLPTTGNEKAINSDDASHFNDFKTAIQNYFPNISGVTATLRYDNGKAGSRKYFNYTTQFLLVMSKFKVLLV